MDNLFDYSKNIAADYERQQSAEESKNIKEPVKTPAETKQAPVKQTDPAMRPLPVVETESKQSSLEFE